MPLRPLLLAGSTGKRALSTPHANSQAFVTYVEKGGVLETHKDVPDEIRDELYMEDQQRQEKEKRKSANILGGETPYPSININVHPSHLPGLATTAPAVD